MGAAAGRATRRLLVSKSGEVDNLLHLVDSQFDAKHQQMRAGFHRFCVADIENRLGKHAMFLDKNEKNHEIRMQIPPKLVVLWGKVGDGKSFLAILRAAVYGRLHRYVAPQVFTQESYSKPQNIVNVSGHRRCDVETSEFDFRRNNTGSLLTRAAGLGCSQLSPVG